MSRQDVLVSADRARDNLTTEGIVFVEDTTANAQYGSLVGAPIEVGSGS